MFVLFLASQTRNPFVNGSSNYNQDNEDQLSFTVHQQQPHDEHTSYAWWWGNDDVKFVGQMDHLKIILSVVKLLVN